MITRERDEVVEAKQEGNKTTSDEMKTKSKASSSSISAASPWSRLKDPRIVRVSRAFGGKDRHSKVCTVRGLRDRRVRLSVPTAIQLYDLQDRLGLNQPSKVVDWLLSAAKNEIDELPPLPMIPGSFNHSLQPILTSHHHGVEGNSTPQSNKGGHRNSASINWDDPPEPSESNMWHSDALFRTKSKEVARGDSSEDKETWTRSEEGKQPSHFESSAHGTYFSSNHFFSRLDHSPSSSPGLLNSAMPYNSLIRWDPSHLSLSQSGNPGLAPHQEDNFGVVPLPSTVSSWPSGPQQVLVYHQLGTTTQPCFPQHITAAAEYASSRPFHLLGTTTKLLPSQNDRQVKQNEDSEFHSR